MDVMTHFLELVLEGLNLKAGACEKGKVGSTGAGPTWENI